MKKFRKSFEICFILFMIMLSTAVALMLATAKNISKAKNIRNANERSYSVDDKNGFDWVYCQTCRHNTSIQLVNCSYSKCKNIPPGLPSTTEQLIMRGNHLIHISRVNLSNLSQLLHLDLSYCSIYTIESESFSQLVRLEVLNLSKNPFLEKYPDHLFSPLINLTQLLLTGTRSPCDFSLDLLQNLTKLEVLWFGSNQFCEFPRFRKNSTLLPHLKELSFESNNIVNLNKDNHNGLEVLETLVLSRNRIIILPSDVFQRYKKLSRLVLDRNYLTPGRYAFSSKSLKDLSLNYITPEFRVARKAFNALSNLEKLSLEGSTALFRNAFPFGRFPNLVQLNLRGTGVRSDMLGRITASLPKLRYLDLNDNDIDILRDTMFRKLELEVLLLGSNWLKIVDMTSLPFKTWSHIQLVDFSNNMLLECDCSIVWFRRWLRDPKKNATVDNLSKTTCSARGVNNISISIYDLKEPTDEKCFSDESDLCLIAVFAVVVMICFLSSATSTLYRFRWQIKYYYFRQVVSIDVIYICVKIV